MHPSEKLLSEALEVVRQRRGTYGPCTEHFARTAAMVSAMLSHKLREPITAADWAAIMLCDKLSRHQGAARTADTPIDLAGYAACLAECEA